MSEKKPVHSSNPKDSLGSSQVTVVGQGTDKSGRRYVKLRVGSVNLPPAPLDQVSDNPSALYRSLVNAGASVFTPQAKRAVLEEIQARSSEAPVTFRVATYPGWHGSTLVFPDRVFGQTKLVLETSFDGLDPEMLAKYRSRGTIKEWQDNVLALCVNNSRLLFAVSLAAAPLILPFTKGPRSGGFQLFGDPETGKTAGGMVAGSFWGCHVNETRREKGFSESWNTTPGAAQRTSFAHNNSLNIFDETNLAGTTAKTMAQNCISIIFGVSEGTEKERLTNVGPTRSALNFMLSTSNFSVDQLCELAGREPDGAERGRLVDVPLPKGGHGLYEELNGFESGRDLTDALKANARNFFGTGRLHYAKALQAHRKTDKDGLKRFIRRRRRDYLKALAGRLRRLEKRDTKFVAPLQRASARFATVFAAGALAVRYETFNIERADLLEAILSCQIDGLTYAFNATVQRPDSTTQDWRSQLKNFLNDNKADFIDLDTEQLDSKEHKFGSVPGYWATYKEIRYIYLTNEKFVEILGDRAETAKRQLAAEGMLAVKSKRFVVQRRIFRNKRNGTKNFRTVYAIHADFLDCVN